jgi:hypothetical protein
MGMASSQSFSHGMDVLIRDLRGYGATGTSCFPRSLSPNESRREPNESLHAWFARLTDNFAGGQPKACAIEDNIAVFAAIDWQERVLAYANIQVLVVDCDLEDFYVSQPARGQYLRLDFDKNTLGEPFSHPLPHIQVGEGCSARFSLDGGTSGNVVVDFMEFVYRQYAPRQWRQWVERTWNAHFEKMASDDEEDNPLTRIFEAFDRNQLDILRDMGGPLRELKEVLRHRKDQFFRPHADRSDRELLEYPTAR